MIFYLKNTKIRGNLILNDKGIVKFYIKNPQIFIQNKWKKFNAKILIKFPYDYKPIKNCYVQLFGHLEKIPSPKNPYDITYKPILRRYGINSQISIPKGGVLKYHENFSAKIRNNIRTIRKYISHAVTHGQEKISQLSFFQHSSSVIKAIILGDTQNLDKTLREKFRSSVTSSIKCRIKFF